MIVFRDFEFFIGEEKVGVATSRWCVVDLQTFAIKPALLAFPEEPIEYNDFRSVDFADWKISDLENKKVAYQKVVTYSDYDHYNHVNNTKYADFILDVFNVEELKNKSILSVQITYSKQCKIGEVLTFSVGNDNEFYYIDGRVDGELRVSAKIKFSRLNG
jgi:acyl-ACP thioesterase